MTRRNRSWTLAAVLVAVGCGDGPAKVAEDRPVPGELVFILSPGGTAPGAARLKIDGPDVTGAWTPVEGLFSLAYREGASLHAVVAGDHVAGPVARLAVPDLRDAPLYSVRSIEVADRDNAIRDDVSGYTVRVEAIER